MAEIKPIVVCPNNHHFNPNLYGEECPICGELIEEEKAQEELEQELFLTSGEWVCGWIICLDGINKGREYRVKSGKNFIGSNPNMDIYIRGDESVDEYSHAVIMYDSKARETLLLPGRSRGMTYVEEQAVYEPVNLESYAKITIGKQKYLYILLAGSNFDWSDLE